MPATLKKPVSPWTLTPNPKRRWERAKVDPARLTRLLNSGRYTPLLSKILAARGFDTHDEIDAFMNPSLGALSDPFLLKGMTEAVERIAAALKREEPIYIFGDYDVDGVTATAILRSVFDFLCVPVGVYIPHRLNEGYGMRAESVRSIAERGAKLIITVDNGITAHEAIEAARVAGVDVIISDHHEPGETLPSAYAVINPKQDGCGYPFKELCGAGVAFKLAHGILKKCAPDANSAKEFLKSLLDFAALGTVADVVPLRGENRCFVTHGLNLIREGRRQGFRSLFEVIGSDPKTLNAGSVSFTIVPRLNAAGRTEHAMSALDLLLADEPARARELSSQLNRLNDERRRIELDIVEEAMGMIDEEEDSPVIVLAQEGWHLGVVGIVASRVLDKYHRPVIVLGMDGDEAKGSARSIPGFDMHAALGACAEHLEQFGGHTMAAGLRIRSENLPAFRSAIHAYARETTDTRILSPALTMDAVATPEDITLDNAISLEGLAPFGAENPRALLEIEGFSLAEEPRVLKEKHLKLRLCAPDGRIVQGIGFGLGERASELKMGLCKLRLAASLSINDWNGRRTAELEIKDFQTD